MSAVFPLVHVECEGRNGPKRDGEHLGRAKEMQMQARGEL